MSGRPPNALFFAAPGLAAALGTVFFGVRPSIIVVAGDDPPALLLHCARFSSVRGRAVLCRCQKRNFVEVGHVKGHHLLQRLGQGIPTLFYGWPAEASGQGGMVGRMEKESGC
jgi:hypothetical protein